MGGEYTFYGDESYGEVDAYSVAGYLASVEQWKRFNEEWKTFRREEDFCVLHKRELEHNVKGSDFEWPELSSAQKAEKKKRINIKACELILKYARFGIVGSKIGVAITSGS